MWFYVAVVVGVALVLYIALSLRRSTNNNGGSIDLFFDDADDEKEALARAAREAEENLRYTKLYTDPGKQVLVLFGSEYGFSAEIARKVFDALLKLNADGIQPRLVNLKDYNGMCDLQKEQLALVICSTTGDGVPPTDARETIEALLKKDKAKFDLSTLRYTVLALGDNNYPHFCHTGRRLDEKLSALGAASIVPRVDVDQEDWDAINGWLGQVLGKLSSLDLEVRTDYITERTDTVSNEKHNRSKPYWAKVLRKFQITKEIAKPKDKRNYEEDKEVIHIEFELPPESELNYTSGDALGVYPTNNPAEVDAFLLALAGAGSAAGKDGGKEKGKEKVAEGSGARAKEIGELKVTLPKSCYEDTSRQGGRSSSDVLLREALLRYYDLKAVRPEFLSLMARFLEEEAEGADEREKQTLAQLLKNGGVSLKENKELREFLKPREMVDVLELFPSFFAGVKTSSIIADILANMKTLQPRYYSISSSPLVEQGKATVTAAVVRYETLSRPRTGVATTFMADRLDVGQACPVFISKNPDFRLPADPSLPIIMVGPGTGIAPFRAFIQERLQNPGGGVNLLYFGCRNKDVDYLYKDEMEALAGQEKIKLRTAFSRDQKEKVYVQHRLLEDAALVWDLLTAGAHVYVCGDATRMAGDVHNALLQIIQEKGNHTAEEAKDYMEKLQEQKRYERDVWVT